MLLELGMCIFSLYLILQGSDWITDSSAHIAKRLGTTHVAVGLLLVSALLSLPEIVVAVSSILKGYTDIGIGVSLGSAIVNIGLITGISALVRPLRVSRIMVMRDAVFMVVVTLIVAAMTLQDMQLVRMDGLVFLLLFIPYIVNVYEQERMLSATQKKLEVQKLTKTLRLFGKVAFGELVFKDGLKIFLFGIAFLIIGGELFTRSMIFFASSFNIPGFIIGITLGALGPSLPNLASAVQAAKRGLEELAVSETIGSNIFTLLITLGIIALASPQKLNFVTAVITIPALLLMSFMLLFFMMRGHIGRKAGAILVGAYVAVMLIQLYFAL